MSPCSRSDDSRECRGIEQPSTGSGGAAPPALSSALAQALFGDIARAKERGTFPEVGEEFDFLTYALARSRASHAQLAQDLWVLFELGERRRGYFIEFGAGDGIRLSNTWLLERAFDWTGVLAEPNPEFHAALRRNRRCHISTYCIAGAGQAEVVFTQTADPHFATIERYADQDMHAARRASGTRITVPAQTLEDLLHGANAPRRIDYLSIDTEGSEYEILKDFDFAARDVHLVTVEHNFTDRREALHVLLTRHGFRQRFPGLTRFDDWYVNTRLSRWS
jgi:FkbM family methyltransferase